MTAICTKRQRSDPNRNFGGTITQAERTMKQKRQHPLEAETETQSERFLKHGGETDDTGIVDGGAGRAPVRVADDLSARSGSFCAR